MEKSNRQRELPTDAIVCGATFGDGSNMAKSGLALCGGSGQDFLAKQIEEV